MDSLCRRCEFLRTKLCGCLALVSCEQPFLKARPFPTGEALWLYVDALSAGLLLLLLRLLLLDPPPPLPPLLSESSSTYSNSPPLPSSPLIS